MRRTRVILGLGVAAIIVFSCVVGAVFVGQSEVDKLNGFAPSEAPRQMVTLVISSDGADWHASNAYQTVYGGAGDNGGVDGADAAAVIQAAYDALGAGQAILIRSPGSDVRLQSALMFDTDNTAVYGEGLTTLAKTGGGNIVTVTGNNCELANLDIDNYGSTATSAIKIQGVNTVLRNVVAQGVPGSCGIWLNTNSWNCQFWNVRTVNCLQGIRLDDADANNLQVFGGGLYSNVASAVLIDYSGGDNLHVYGTDFEGTATTTGICVNAENSIMRLIGPRFETFNVGVNWQGVKGANDVILAPSFSGVTTKYSGTIPTTVEINDS